MEWLEPRSRGVTVECGGCIGAGRGASTILHVIVCEGRWVRAGAWLLVVIMTSGEEQSVGAWLAGSSGSSLANGANGLLLHVAH
jgi:hypothetical protein